MRKENFRTKYDPFLYTSEEVISGSEEKKNSKPGLSFIPVGKLENSSGKEKVYQPKNIENSYDTFPHTSIVSPPRLDETSSILKILSILKPHIDYKTLVKQNQDKKLENLCKSVEKIDLLIPELKKDLKNQTFCPNCNESCFLLHSCFFPLCVKCTKINKNSCISCKQKLSEGFLFKLFENTLKC